MSQALDELRHTIARLRGPGGCPWDQEQTHESLVRCLIDEVSELIETIDHADMPHMREELGDVLIQVVFHAQIAEEAGHFGFDDVAREVNAKLIRRHPHVFGEGEGRPIVENTAQLSSSGTRLRRKKGQQGGPSQSRNFSKPSRRDCPR